MKCTISIVHHMDGYNDVMFNIAVKYGIRYKKYETDTAAIMVFTIREKIEDLRTQEYLQDVLCYLFQTEPAYDAYPPSEDVSIYTILLAFVDVVRNHYSDKHYREAIRRFHECRHVDMVGSMPVIHKLSNGNYTLTPVVYDQIGYNTRERLAPEQVQGRTQVQSKTRDHNHRAVYRNFNWDTLYECCRLYRDFCDGNEFYDTEQIYLLARNLCGAENGKKHFLEIMAEKHADEFYSGQNWKEILTAIIKGDIPLASCDECDWCDSCPHAETMLATAKPQRYEIRRVQQEEDFVSLDEVTEDLHTAFERAIHAQDNSIHIIKAQTGAGKTETYLQYMKHSEKPLLVAVPTHALKKEILRKAMAMGIGNICCTPDLEEYQLSESVKSEVNKLYAIGAGVYVLRYLTELLTSIKHTDPDYEHITRYLHDLKHSTRSDGHIITTHARLLYMRSEVLNSHEVLIDEDILRTAMHTNCVSMSDLQYVRKMRIFYGDARRRLDALCQKRGYHRMEQLAYDKDVKLPDQLRNISSDICGLLGAGYVYITGAMVHYLSDIPLPPGKLTILSATADAELYQRFYPDRQIDHYECKKAKYVGKIRQHTDCSYSSYILEKHPEKVSVLYLVTKEDVVITLKGIEHEFNTKYHFGNVEGLNLLSGKDLSVIGLPNKPDFVYCLYGMRAGVDLTKTPNMYVQRIEQGSYSFSLNTFMDPTLQKIQSWILSSQLEQAVGRARLLRNHCTVTVYAGFPVEQTEFIS